MVEHGVSGFPVTLDGSRRGEIVGILTRRDMKFIEPDRYEEVRVGEVMTKENLIKAPAETTVAQAEKILNKARVEKLLLVDGAKLPCRTDHDA